MIAHEVPDLSHVSYSIVVPYISHVSGITGCNFSWLKMNAVRNYWVQAKNTSAFFLKKRIFADYFIIEI